MYVHMILVYFDTFDRVGVSECLITYMNHFLIEKFKSVLTSFQTMKKADQEKYLLLSNKYDESDTLNEELSEWLKRNTDISMSKASTIVGVFVSNMYEMGVGIGKYIMNTYCTLSFHQAFFLYRDC